MSPREYGLSYINLTRCLTYIGSFREWWKNGQKEYDVSEINRETLMNKLRIILIMNMHRDTYGIELVK
jgi:hypothetical protein